MTSHQARIVALAAFLVGIGALVLTEACAGAPQTPEELRELAEQGDVMAQGDLGFM